MTYGTDQYFPSDDILLDAQFDADNGPITNSTTDPKHPGGDDGASVSYHVDSNSLDITVDAGTGGDTSAFGTFSFDLPSGSLDHITIGENFSGSTLSFTFDIDAGGFGQNFTHDFGDGWTSQFNLNEGADGSISGSVGVTWSF